MLTSRSGFVIDSPNHEIARLNYCQDLLLEKLAIFCQKESPLPIDLSSIMHAVCKSTQNPSSIPQNDCDPFGQQFVNLCLLPQNYRQALLVAIFCQIVLFPHQLSIISTSVNQLGFTQFSCVFISFMCLHPVFIVVFFNTSKRIVGPIGLPFISLSGCSHILSKKSPPPHPSIIHHACMQFKSTSYSISFHVSVP